MCIKRLVEVYVARPDTAETGIYEFATGYLIGRDREGMGIVLTAGHVLVDSHGKIEVRFRNTNDRAKYPVCDLIHDFRKDRPSLDFALLKTQEKPPEEITSDEPIFEPSDPPRDRPAICDGYPQLTKEGRRDQAGDRGIVSLKGDIGAFDPHKDYVALNSATILKQPEEGWKGISGAPVFVDHRIVGVVARHDQAVSTTTLELVPSLRFLEIPTFREAIDWFKPLDTERRSRIYAEIELKLNALSNESKRSVTSALAKTLFGSDFIVESGKEADHIKSIAKSLAFKTDSKNQFGKCVRIYVESRKRGDTDSSLLMHKILGMILTLEIDERLLADLYAQVKLRKMALIGTPVNYRQTFEVMITTVEDKEHSFVKKKDGRIGSDALICDLPAPSTKSAMEFAVKILKSIRDAKMSDSSIDTKLDLEAQLRGLVKDVAGMLKALDDLTLDGRRPYCFLERMKSDDEREIFQAAINLPEMRGLNLLFVEISNDGSSPISEHEAYMLTLLNHWFDYV